METATKDDDDRALIEENDDHGVAFLTAAIQGDLARLKTLLRPDLNIDTPRLDSARRMALHGPQKCWRPLEAAIMCNHTHVVGFLVAIGADMEARSQSHTAKLTALHSAARVPCPAVVRLLLEAGADTRTEFQLGQTDRGPATLLVLPKGVYEPGQTSDISQRHFETLEVLLNAGIDVNAPSTKWGRGTLLQQAARCCSVDMTKMLLEKGAIPGPDLVRCAVMDKRWQCEGEYTFHNERHLKMVKYLVKDLGLADFNNEALREVAMGGDAKTTDIDIEICKVLLSSCRIDLEAQNIRDIFCGIAGQGPTRLLSVFLDAGVDVNGRDRWGYTAFINAACSRFTSPEVQLRVLKLLLERGADVNVLVTRPQFDNIAPLQPAGGNVLHQCLHAPLVEITRFLLEAKVDPEARNDDGETPLIALSRSFGDMRHPRAADAATFAESLDLLIVATSNVNAVDNYGRAAVHHVVSSSHSSVVAGLLTKLCRKGARLEVVDRFGETPSSILQRKKGVSVQRFLLQECG